MTARADAVEETRRRMLEAAVALHLQRLSSDISLADVAAEAGVSVQTVLRHFGNRDELLVAAALQWATADVEQERRSVPGDVAGAVRAVVDHYELRGDGVLLLLAQEGVGGFAARVTTTVGRCTALGHGDLRTPSADGAGDREEARRPARRRHRRLHVEAASPRPPPVGGQDPGAHGGARARGPRRARDPTPRPVAMHTPGRSVHPPAPLKESAMAEIVVVTWDGGGNVPPAFAIAAELAARGHGIRVLGHRSQRRAIEAAGFAAVPGPRDPRVHASGATHSGRELIATFGDRGTGRDLLQSWPGDPADLVLVDALTFGALEAVRAWWCALRRARALLRRLLPEPPARTARTRPARPRPAPEPCRPRRSGSRHDVAARARQGATERDGAPGRPGRLVETARTCGADGPREPEHLRLRRDARAPAAGARRVRRASRTGRRDDRAAHRPVVAAGARGCRAAPVRATRGADAARERRRRPRWPRHGDAGAGARRTCRGPAHGPSVGPPHGGPQPRARRGRPGRACGSCGPRPSPRRSVRCSPTARIAFTPPGSGARVRASAGAAGAADALEAALPERLRSERR